jgi:hypothetical protein
LHFHVFSPREQILNQNKPKQIRLSEFVFLVSSEAVTTCDIFVYRFASREAAMPTETVRKTEAKQQGTHLAWCVCCVEKGKLRAVFSVLLRHSRRFDEFVEGFSRSLCFRV